MENHWHGRLKSPTNYNLRNAFLCKIDSRGHDTFHKKLFNILNLQLPYNKHKKQKK